MRHFFIGTVALLCGLTQSANAQSADGEPAALVQMVTAKQATLHPEVPAYGTVVPDPDGLVTVAIPRDGIIARVSVRAGQLVQTGDPIVAIETAPGAMAIYQQAQSAMAFAARDLSHTKTLYAQQLATKSQLANAQKAYTDAQAQVAAQVKIGASKTGEVLRASAAGIVTKLNVSPGDRVSANTIIASIAARDRLLVNLGLEPQDALQAKVGGKVWLRSPQRKSVNFAGPIQSVDAMMDPTSRLVNAVVGVPQTIAGRLVLGMVLQGAVQFPAAKGIAVPHSALMTDRKGNYVFVVKNGIAHRHGVQISFESDTQVLIAHGVAGGDHVVSAGNAGLSDGTHVRVH